LAHTADAAYDLPNERRPVDDPKQHVDDELEGRLDDLSSTLTDDEIRGESEEGSQWAGVESDADDTDVDADDTDQDADADDPS
jgi:hypothetical protein